MPSHTLAAVVAWLGVVLAARLPAAGAVLPPIPTSRCQRKCGEIDIPYPFGIGPECAMAPGFNLTCEETGDGGGRPFFHDLQVVGISLQQGQTRVLNHISSFCYNTSIRGMQFDNWRLNFTGTPYRLSDTNKFTVIGCQTLAYISDEYNVGKYMSGCVAMCRRGDVTVLTNGSCSGIGCCQTAIPKEMQYYRVRFDYAFNTTEIYKVSRCSYAVLMDPSNFTFLASYATSPEFYSSYRGQAPLLLDWAIGKESCDIAKRKPESYACVSNNSECFNSPNGPGYICNCTKGFKGNPYLQNGCQDIDECNDPKNYPCHNGLCQNEEGRFSCYCPPGTRGNASVGSCEKELTKGQRLAIGIIASVLVVLLVFLGIERIKFKQRTKRQDFERKRDAYFHQHGGQILKDFLERESSNSFELYEQGKIELATNNFDERAIIGEGGQGTVYKGYGLHKKNNPVAIKRCKGFDESRREEFGNELLILSRVKHDNIVKLLGCCLQLEVPVLVYEFVPNDTLHNLIHVQSEASVRTLDIRLKIASESADAIAHLHSQDKPILHGDVKSANILIGENFVAKVSDFGCSTIWTADQSPNVVKGTIGYLDPEYLLKFELSDKSDVYSFGVVLLELLTRKRPLSRKKECLASVFQETMKRGNIEDLVDKEIVHEDNTELVRQVADLAGRCLVMAGESRPTMSRVAEELRRLAGQVHQRHGSLEGVGQLAVYGRSAGDPSEYRTGVEETTDYYSLKKKAAMNIEFAR